MRSAVFEFESDSDGFHEVRVSFSPHNRAGEVKYRVTDEKGAREILVDQRKSGNQEKILAYLGHI